jgi:hypothetical protein
VKLDLCLDGRNYEGFTGVCNRSSDGKVCLWERKRCPIVLSVTLPIGSTLTPEDIEKIRASLSVNDKDFSYIKEENPDGTTTYLFTFNRDGMPPSFDDPNKANDEVSTTVKESHPNAVSMIYEGPKSFATILVLPFMGFLIMLFI